MDACASHRTASAARLPVACPDTSRCPDQPATVFRIAHGERNAAFGNLFYSVVSNGVLYARHKGHVPWISFDPKSVAKTMGRGWERDGPLWERFFEGYCANVSAWLDACPNVRLAPPAERTFNKSFWYPFVQQKAPWAVRQWYNYNSLELIACLNEGWCRRFNEVRQLSRPI